MALAQRLELRQGQSLVMTPQLQQAIKLLQLSNLELAEYVEQELEKNPLLERDERERAAGEEREAPEGNTAPDEPLEAALARDDFSKAADMDADHGDLYTDDQPAAGREPNAPLTDWTSLKNGPRFEGDEDSIERSLSQAATLKDHLLDQLSIAALAPEARLIAAALIDCIDEAGYLRADLEELASRLGAPGATVCDVLRRLQGFEPTGVAARDLAECLALQLREKGRLDPCMQAFLAHLDLVARRDMAGVAAHCGVDAEDVADMIAEIRALTP